MLFRTACMTAGVAALALPAFAQKPAIQPGMATRLDPVSARSFTIVDGRVVFTSDTIALTPDEPGIRTPWTPAYDNAELDLSAGILGPPTDNTPGCQWQVPIGARWWFGHGINNPFVSNDITTDAAGAGQLCTGVGFEWGWSVGTSEPGQASPCSIWIITYEDMDTTCDINQANDGSNPLDGIVFNYASVPHGIYYGAVDLTASGLFLTMPADGEGGYQIFFTRGDFDGDGTLSVGDLTAGIDTTTQLGVAAQPMLWGTGEDEIADGAGTPQPDGRIGTQVPAQYDDDNANLVHDVDDTNPDFVIPLECYAYNLTYQGNMVCPTPVGAMAGFYYKPGGNPCPCIGDLDGDGDRDISDLSSLLSAFGQTGDPGSLGCADTDGDGDVDITDLASLLGTFGVPC